jgi:hypothetical protein
MGTKESPPKSFMVGFVLLVSGSSAGSAEIYPFASQESGEASEGIFKRGGVFDGHGFLAGGQTTMRFG